MYHLLNCIYHLLPSLLPRSRLSVHCIPQGYCHDALTPTLVHLFLCHAHFLGSGHTSKTNSFLMSIFTFGTVLILFFFFSLQFVVMEVMVTSCIDMFPAQMRKAGRREWFLLLLCLVVFFCQFIMITEVSIY